MSDKKKKVLYTTPITEAHFPALTTLDFKYKKDFGEWHTKQKFDPSNKEHQKFLDQMEALHDVWVTEATAALTPKQKKSEAANVNPFALPMLDDDGEETGILTVNFKMAGAFKNKDGEIREMKPKYFDARGNPLKKAPKIGSGSKLRLSFNIGEYAGPKGMGLTCYLVGVQIVELVEWGGGASASEMGFGVVDGGYSATEEADAQGFSNEETGGSPDDDGGDF